MKSICVFGSSSEKIDRTYLETAEQLGRALAQRDCEVVFGAGRYGVMGAVARGVIDKGGRLVGVSPEFFKSMDVLESRCGEIVFTETMRERKAIMEDRADAFVICAGGIGTFEEFFEVITLKQLGRHEKPIIIYNVNGYYNPLIEMMRHSVENNFMSDDVNGLYSVAGTLDELFEQLDGYRAFTYNKYS